MPHSHEEHEENTKSITQLSINDLCFKIVGCAIRVHQVLGPGLLESIYEECMLMEMEKLSLRVERQLRVPIIYDGKQIGTPLRLDILVEDLIILELKAVENFHSVYSAQLLSYLKLSKKPKGLLINFNCVKITDSLIPLVTDEFSRLPKS
jgi:GxxExxY protein